MREIVFDTETTGLSFPSGDRLVEIGCVELHNRVETGRVYHAYHHPERSMPADAAAIHGLTDAFLSDKSPFGAGVDDLLAFLGDDPVIAHNATFDMGFLNGELIRCGRPPIAPARVTDTLAMARTRYPGAKHSLDALCSRFGVDRSHRVLHGALLDAQLLAQVYVELTGGRQIGLSLAPEVKPAARAPAAAPAPRADRPVRVFAPSPGELKAHRAFIASLNDPLWGAEASG